MTAAGFSRYAVAAVLVGVLAGFSAGGSSRGVAAAEDVLLSGKVVSSTGERLAGVPVRARRANSPIAVTVYTNGEATTPFPNGRTSLRVRIRSRSSFPISNPHARRPHLPPAPPRKSTSRSVPGSRPSPTRPRRRSWPRFRVQTSRSTC